MDFEEFKEALVKDMKTALDFRLETNTEVEIKHNTKTNYSYEALNVRPEGAEVGVSIDCNKLYAAYTDGVDYRDIIAGMTDQLEKSLKDGPGIDIDMFSDYAQLKDKLSIEVISAERNKDILESVPHKNLEDMAIVYRFNVGRTPEGMGTVLVTNDMLDKYGITAEQLHADALKSAPEIRPVVIKGMSEFLVEMMGNEQASMLGFEPVENEPILVASVPDNNKGAGIIAYTDFMDKAAERIGGDFYILPSSIHEILIVPDNGKMGLPELENMVKEVNATQVSPQDKLTDNVYHYDSQAKIFELGEKFVERQAEREEQDIDKEEKGSVLGELKAKKEEVSKWDGKAYVCTLLFSALFCPMNLREKAVTHILFLPRNRKEEKMNTTLKEETLGQRLKAARVRKNMTQEELAEAMLTTKSMISYYENDHGDMKQSMIAEFADVLGTTVEYLICGVIKTPELDADSVEMLKLFGAMDDKTRQIMLVQMRAVAKI